MLWSLRYRKAYAGAQTAWIEAGDEDQARAVGQTWCNQQPGYVFIGVEQAIVAGPEILGPRPTVAVSVNPLTSTLTPAANAVITDIVEPAPVKRRPGRPRKHEAVA